MPFSLFYFLLHFSSSFSHQIAFLRLPLGTDPAAEKYCSKNEVNLIFPQKGDAQGPDASLPLHNPNWNP